MAVSTINRMMAPPAAPSGFVTMNLRTAGQACVTAQLLPTVTAFRCGVVRRTSCVTAISTSLALAGLGGAVADPGVQPGIEQIDDQIDEDDDERGQQHHRLHDRNIATQDGIDDEAAQPVERKNGLRDHQPAHQEGELRADDGDHRQHGIFQSMFDDHEELAQALRPGRANVVLPHDLQHRRARQARAHRGIAVAHGDDGPEQLLDVLPRVLPERDEHQRRAPLEVDDEEEDEQDAGPEVRDRQTADADDAHAIVHPGVLPDGRQRAQRDGDQGRDQRREDGHLEGQGEADTHLLDHRRPGPQRVAEVQANDAPDPGEELHVERAVEPQLVSHLLELSQVDVAALLARAQDQQGDIPGDDVHEQEDHQGDSEQGRNHQEDPLEDVLPHDDYLDMTFTWLSATHPRSVDCSSGWAVARYCESEPLAPLSEETTGHGVD